MLKNGLVVPPWQTSEQRIIEQACASLEIPLESIIPMPHNQEIVIPSSTPDFASQIDLSTAIVSNCDMSTLNQIRQDSQASQTTPFDLVDWTEFPSSEP